MPLARRTRRRPYTARGGDGPAEELLAKARAEMAVYDELPADWRELVQQHGFDRAGGFTVLKPLAMRARRERLRR